MSHRRLFWAGWAIVAAYALVVVILAEGLVLWLIVATPPLIALAAGWLWVARYLDEPLSDTDRYCDAVDRELDEQSAPSNVIELRRRSDAA